MAKYNKGSPDTITEIQAGSSGTDIWLYLKYKLIIKNKPDTIVIGKAAKKSVIFFNIFFSIIDNFMDKL